MQIHSREYPKRAREGGDVRASVTGATLSFDARRRAAFAGVAAEEWRVWAEGVKTHLLTHLDRYLEEAEAKLEANGARVHWAGSQEDVHRILSGIIERRGARRAVKGKSMLSEELEVNELLEKRGVDVLETDLGEYILQLLEQPPSHIVGPAIHLSLHEIRRLYHETHGTELDATPDELAGVSRLILREAFLAADVGITGGNFLVAETGTVALIENEGNIRLTTSAPPVHVALVGIEKLLPRWSDLAVFLQLTARAATGQPVGNYVSMIHGPRTADDPDGPEEVHVVLVDNGRTDVLADAEAWEALRCVRCGACLNACPVYRQTGGHAYGAVYSGPIGSVLNPGLAGLHAAMPLPFASSLCGACEEACPVRIPIPELLLSWRRRAAEAGMDSRAKAGLLKAWTAVATRPGVYRAAGAMLHALPEPVRRVPLPVVGGWREVRKDPEPSRASFRDLWREGIE